MKCLITGGCGFAGSNLAAKVLEKGAQLSVLDNLFRNGSEANLRWLKQLGKFEFFHSDIRNYNDVETTIRLSQPDVIFHLAGQVAMTTSLRNPKLDFEINTLGTFNLLEAVRNYSPNSCILYSSTNKVYGDLDYLTYEETASRYVCKEYPYGFDEKLPLDFSTPYGCSKGAADQYLLDYFKVFDIKTVVFRHSTMYGGRQFATFDQGWIGWFCQKAVETKNGSLKEPFTIAGTGKQVRDVLYADDLIELYFKVVENIETAKGKVYNVGGGFENSLSLLELFSLLEEELDITLNYKKLKPRKSDQKVYISNIGKLERDIGWKPEVNKRDGISKMLKWVEKHE